MSGLEEIIGFSKILNLINKNIVDLKPKEIQKVKVVTDPYEFSKTIIRRAPNITVIAKPDKPQIEIVNPLDADIKVMSITLIPDAAFKTKGLALLTINDTSALEIENSGDATDFSTINVPLPNEGADLKRFKKIKLFAWTSDGTASAITSMVHFQK